MTKGLGSQAYQLVTHTQTTTNISVLAYIKLHYNNYDESYFYSYLYIDSIILHINKFTISMVQVNTNSE